MSQTTIDPRSLRAPPRRPLRLSWSDERVRGIVWQVLVVGVVGAIVWWLWSNTVHNLEVRRIATGFGFLGREAGLPIAESVIDYSPTDTYLRALTVGLLNTLKVAVVGIILATILGTLIGIARLSKNWLLAKIAAVYVEVIRDLPLLLQLLFWYAHPAGPARAAPGAEPGGRRVPLQPRAQAALDRMAGRAFLRAARLPARRRRHLAVPPRRDRQADAGRPAARGLAGRARADAGAAASWSGRRSARPGRWTGRRCAASTSAAA